MRPPRQKIFGAYDAKTRFSEILEMAAAGQEVTITKHGAPVAKLVGVRKKATTEKRKVMIERWKESSKGITLGHLKLRDLLEEGRP